MAKGEKKSPRRKRGATNDNGQHTAPETKKIKVPNCLQIFGKFPLHTAE